MLSSQFLQAILDALPTPIFVKDRQGLYLGCNRAFSETLGKQLEDIAGKSVFDLWPTDLAQRYYEADEALMSSGQVQHYEAQISLPSGERRDVMFYKALLRDEQGEVAGLVGTLLDITERKTLERSLTTLAELDPLTGLLNRRAIFNLMEQLTTPHAVAVMMCDLDNFKHINDTYGHFGGDAVLREVARILRAQLRNDDRIARIGGEEFLILLQHTGKREAERVAQRLLRAVSAARIKFDLVEIQVTVSIGMAMGEAADAGIINLVRLADDRLYQAKCDGRNRIVATSHA